MIRIFDGGEAANYADRNFVIAEDIASEIEEIMVLRGWKDPEMKRLIDALRDED